MSDLVTRLLPTLAAPAPKEFNVFDVMHHGRHEKQASNVFAWLLRADGTHNLGDRFLRCFIDEVNARLQALGRETIRFEHFIVEQEQNTRSADKGADIADIVLQGEHSVLVVENYYVSDGHGHNYCAYLEYGQRLGLTDSVVVMLCALENRALLRDGWERAPVVTYASLINRLFRVLEGDPDYGLANPEPFSFLCQLRKHFMKRKQVNDDTSLEFIKLLCETGEAQRYGFRDGDVSFGEFIRNEAERKFEESKEVLQTLKSRLRDYLTSSLPYLNEHLGAGHFDGTKMNFVGIYQWDISLTSNGDRTLYVLFGPSAWADNEMDKYKSWDAKVKEPDYSHLFIGVSADRQLRQSAVTMEDVANGLAPDDTRLLDEIVAAVRGTSTLSD